MMRGLILPALMIALPCAVASAAHASPPDRGTECGSRFPAQLKAAIIAPSGHYPFRWVGMTVKGNVITVSLQVNVPGRPVLYDGFRCRLGTDGTITPLPFASATK